ncbi:uncharacterized protein LOC144828105 [Lissotriton helveticus]
MLTSTYLQAARYRSKSLEAEVNKIASKLMDTVLNKMLNPEPGVKIALKKEQYLKSEDDNDTVAIIVNSVYINVLHEIGCPTTIFKAMATGCNLIYKQIARLVVKEIYTWDSKPHSNAITLCDLYTDIEGTRIVNEVLKDIKGYSTLTAVGGNSVNSIFLQMVDTPKEDIPLEITTYFRNELLKTDTAMKADYLSGQDQPLTKPEKQCFSQYDNSLRDLNTALVLEKSMAGKTFDADIRTSASAVVTQNRKRALFLGYGSLDEEPTKVFSRNSVLNESNPNSKNTELLKDENSEGEPGWLKVNVIENNDNFHEIDFKNYINWTVNKQLLEKNYHQANNEPHLNVLKPDVTDVNILKDVTIKGELVFRLDAHNIESYDGDSGIEEFTFNDDTYLMADKHLQKEKEYGRKKELGNPCKSRLQKKKFISFIKRKHFVKCFNSKIGHESSRDDSQKQNRNLVTNKKKRCSVSCFNWNASTPEAYRNTENKNYSFDIPHFTNSGMIGKTLKNEPKGNTEVRERCGIYGRWNNSVQEPNLVKSSVQNNLIPLTRSDISESERHSQISYMNPALTVLKPDMYNAQLLHDVTAVGEQVVRLEAHDIEDSDGGSDFEDIILADETSFLTDVKKKNSNTSMSENSSRRQKKYALNFLNFIDTDHGGDTLKRTLINKAVMGARCGIHNQPHGFCRNLVRTSILAGRNLQNNLAQTSNRDLSERRSSISYMNPALTVLKPDMYNAQLLHDVTAVGEQVVRLEAHDIEDSDGGSDFEDIILADETSFLTDVKKKNSNTSMSENSSRRQKKYALNFLNFIDTDHGGDTLKRTLINKAVMGARCGIHNQPHGFCRNLVRTSILAGRNLQNNLAQTSNRDLSERRSSTQLSWEGILALKAGADRVSGLYEEPGLQCLAKFSNQGGGSYMHWQVIAGFRGKAVVLHPSGNFGHVGGEISLGVYHLPGEGGYELGVVSIGFHVYSMGLNDTGKWGHVGIEQSGTE